MDAILRVDLEPGIAVLLDIFIDTWPGKNAASGPSWVAVKIGWRAVPRCLLTLDAPVGFSLVIGIREVNGRRSLSNVISPSGLGYPIPVLPGMCFLEVACDRRDDVMSTAGIPAKKIGVDGRITHASPQPPLEGMAGCCGLSWSSRHNQLSDGSGIAQYFRRWCVCWSAL